MWTVDETASAAPDACRLPASAGRLNIAAMIKISPLLLLVLAAVGSPAAADRPVIRQVAGQAELGWAEIHNLGAGGFDPNLWRAGTLHILPDRRSPIIAPRLDGVFRNIYAPSAVQVPGGWQLFYGAWDGVDSGNDRIYSVLTRDFLTFSDRRLVIDHGAFIHVCNVSAVRVADDQALLVCTAYPVGPDLNKPAVFRTPLARLGQETSPSPRQPATAPPAAGLDDLAAIEGYEPFARADMNGVNALLLEDGRYRLYFGDFKNWGQVHRATSSDGKRFRYDGPCLDAPLMVNDVKKFAPGDKPCYLMGLHRNTDRLWYALSEDGRHFEPQRELGTSSGPDDRYIVAIGWVVRDDRLLGFVYGAGAVPELNRNRLFARWLQKKVVFTDDRGRSYTTTAALGPDRAMIPLGEAKSLTGFVQVFAEDGTTPLGDRQPLQLMSGGVYVLETPAE